MILEVAGLTTYYGSSRALFDVSLRVRAGEVVSLLGRNGAGKTTTMASIVGMTRSRRGSIELGGARLDRLAAFKRVRAGLGYVPQSGRVFAGLSVRENLEIVRGRRLNGDGWSVRRAFEAFPKLAELRERDAGRLSGGERQMLAVARALMGNPSIVLLDEPSEGLAPVMVQSLGQLVCTLRDNGVGVLLAEQNHRFALALADRAYIIEKGAIQREGLPGELMDSPTLEQHLGV
jgi:branched-chain amino acid transport system ATP-binding protein